MSLPSVAPRIFCRRPHSVLHQGTGNWTGGDLVVGADVQHATRDRVYFVIADGAASDMLAFDISDRTAPAPPAATVIDAIDKMTNTAKDGLVFDSTGRYLYATDGGTNLFTFDLGVAFADEDDPTLISTVTISEGNGIHVLKRIGSTLYILADTVTNNSFQVVDISTPSTPSVSTTTAITGHDIEALAGHNYSDDTLAFPASDTSGKIVFVPVASPGSFTSIQLPTIGGFQIRCDAGIAFSPTPDEDRMIVLCFFVNGTVKHYFWLVFDIAAGLSTALSVCLNEEIIAGVIASLRSPFVSSSPQHAVFSGHQWDDGSGVLHFGVTIRDDTFGQGAELRFYAWGWDGTYTRVPRPSGSVTIPSTYSLSARNQGADSTEWASVGTDASRHQVAVVCLLGDLLDSAPDYVNDWLELTGDFFFDPPVKFSHGIVGSGPGDRVAKTGALEFHLDNSAFNAGATLGGYSPDSPSPISAEVVDGSLVIVTFDPDVVFYGTILKLEVRPGEFEERSVRVECVDVLELLNTTNVERLPLLSNISTEDALLQIWDRVPYAPGTESLIFDGPAETFVHDIVFDRSYDERTKVVGAVSKLVALSRGFFFYRHFGTRGIVYVSLDAYKKASVFFDGVAPILGDSELEKMEPNRERGDVFNDVTVTYYPRRTDSSVVVLFTLQERVRIKKGETAVVDAQYRDPDGKTSRAAGTEMVFPVSATDYDFKAGRGGGGATLTSQLSLSFEIGGTGARIIAENAGPRNGYLFVQLRGKGVYTQEPVSVRVRDLESITKYGLRELSYQAEYISDEADARALATRLIDAHKAPRTFVASVQFAIDSTTLNQSAAHMGATRKIGIQEKITGLLDTDYWQLGTGKLDDTAGADAANLYALDIYSVQRVRVAVKSLGLATCTLDLIPEDTSLRPSGWIDPKDDWVDGEPMTANLLNLHLFDAALSIWHAGAIQSANVISVDTTFADLTDLFFDVAAGQTWQFICALFFVSNATADVRITVIGKELQGLEDITSILSGRFGLLAAGRPSNFGNRGSFGDFLDINIVDSNEKLAILTGRVTSPIDARIQVQGSQKTASGSTTFRTPSFLRAFLAEVPA